MKFWTWKNLFFGCGTINSVQKSYLTYLIFFVFYSFNVYCYKTSSLLLSKVNIPSYLIICFILKFLSFIMTTYVPRIHFNSDFCLSLSTGLYAHIPLYYYYYYYFFFFSCERVTNILKHLEIIKIYINGI